MRHHNWQNVRCKDARVAGTCVAHCEQCATWFEYTERTLGEAMRARGVPEDCDEDVLKEVMEK